MFTLWEVYWRQVAVLIWFFFRLQGFKKKSPRINSWLWFCPDFYSDQSAKWKEKSRAWKVWIKGILMKRILATPTAFCTLSTFTADKFTSSRIFYLFVFSLWIDEMWSSCCIDELLIKAYRKISAKLMHRDTMQGFNCFIYLLLNKYFYGVYLVKHLAWQWIVAYLIH